MTVSRSNSKKNCSWKETGKKHTASVRSHLANSLWRNWKNRANCNENSVLKKNGQVFSNWAAKESIDFFITAEQIEFFPTTEYKINAHLYFKPRATDKMVYFLVYQKFKEIVELQPEEQKELLK